MDPGQEGRRRSRRPAQPGEPAGVGAVRPDDGRESRTSVQPDEVPARLRARGSVPDCRRPCSAMLATLTDDRFSDPGWIFERKFDGDALPGVPRRRATYGCCRATASDLDGPIPELVEALRRSARAASSSTARSSRSRAGAPVSRGCSAGSASPIRTGARQPASRSTTTCSTCCTSTAATPTGLPLRGARRCCATRLTFARPAALHDAPHQRRRGRYRDRVRTGWRRRDRQAGRRALSSTGARRTG